MSDGFPLVKIRTRDGEDTRLSGEADFCDPSDESGLLSGWLPYAHAKTVTEIADKFNLCVGVSKPHGACLNKIKDGHPFLPVGHEYADPITAEILKTQIEKLERLKDEVARLDTPLLISLLPCEGVKKWMDLVPQKNVGSYFDSAKKFDLSGVEPKNDQGVWTKFEAKKTLIVVDNILKYMGELLDPERTDEYQPSGELDQCCAIWHDLSIGQPSKSGRRAGMRNQPVPDIRIPVALLIPKTSGINEDEVSVRSIHVSTHGRRQVAPKKAFVKGYDIRFAFTLHPEGNDAKNAREKILKGEFTDDAKKELLLRLQFMNVKPFGSADVCFDTTINAMMNRIQTSLRPSPADPLHEGVLPLSKNAFQSSLENLRKPLEASQKIPDELLQQLSPEEKRLLSKSGKENPRIFKKRNAKLIDRQTELRDQFQARQKLLKKFLPNTTDTEPLAIFSPSGDLFLLEEQRNVRKWVISTNLLDSLKLAGVHLNRSADLKQTQKDGSILINLQALGFPSMSELKSVLDEVEHEDILDAALKANTSIDADKQAQYLSLVQKLSTRAVLRGASAHGDQQTQSDAEIYLEILADKSTQVATKIRYTKIYDHTNHQLLSKIGVVWSQRDARQIIERNKSILDGFRQKLTISTGKFEDCLPGLLQLEYARRDLDPGNQFYKLDDANYNTGEANIIKQDVNRILIELNKEIVKPSWSCFRSAAKKPTAPEAASDLGLLFDQIQSATKAVQKQLVEEGLTATSVEDRSRLYPTTSAKNQVFEDWMGIVNDTTDVVDVAAFVAWSSRTTIYIGDRFFDENSSSFGGFLTTLAAAPFAFSFGGIGLVENFVRGLQVRGIEHDLEGELVRLFPAELNDLGEEVENLGGKLKDRDAIHRALWNMKEKKKADISRRKYRTGLSFVALALSGASAGFAVPILAIIGGGFGALKTIDTAKRLFNDRRNEVDRLRKEETERITTFAQAGVYEALEIGRYLKVFSLEKHELNLEESDQVRRERGALAALMKYSDWADSYSERYYRLDKIK